MSETVMEISIPLDEGEFFRRECPLCNRQFKIHVSKEECQNLVQKEFENYLLQNSGLEIDDSQESDTHDTAEFWCPYCGQLAEVGKWWTREQLEYIHIFGYNIAIKALNESFKDLKNQNSDNGFVSIKFEVNEMPYKKPWISPEPDDMTRRDLPCCHLDLKLDDNYSGPFYCYQCGFLHSQKNT